MAFVLRVPFLKADAKAGSLGITYGTAEAVARRNKNNSKGKKQLPSGNDRKAKVLASLNAIPHPFTIRP
jgi:hypothetical protein